MLGKYKNELTAYTNLLFPFYHSGSVATEWSVLYSGAPER
jgi:hypothetical protein